jgi:ATP-grasp domain
MSNSRNSTFLISNPASESGTLDTLPATPGLQVLTLDQLREQPDLRFGQADKVCLTTESVLADVLDRLDDERRKTAVLLLKDKYAFRQLLQSLYPDFYFKQGRLQDLLSAKFDPNTRYVVKPLKGCFGTGVRVVDGSLNPSKLTAEIETELARNSAVLSGDALTGDEFLIETYLEGEEYAVDMFFDSHQKPVITNIYHHPLPANPAYLHMLYYANRAAFEAVYEPALAFFNSLNAQLQVSNLPIHAEFKLHNGRLMPIELNPFRFGGMGLCNLGYHALGVNAYQCYLENTEPDWASIWKDKQHIYGYFIAYNGAHTDVSKARPNWPLLRQQFSHIILETPFDYTTQLVFGILYIEEQPAAIPALLKIEFDDYFIPLT